MVPTSRAIRGLGLPRMQHGGAMAPPTRDRRGCLPQRSAADDGAHRPCRRGHVVERARSASPHSCCHDGQSQAQATQTRADRPHHAGASSSAASARRAGAAEQRRALGSAAPPSRRMLAADQPRRRSSSRRHGFPTRSSTSGCRRTFLGDVAVNGLVQFGCSRPCCALAAPAGPADFSLTAVARRPGDGPADHRRPARRIVVQPRPGRSTCWPGSWCPRWGARLDAGAPSWCSTAQSGIVLTGCGLGLTMLAADADALAA